MKAIIRGLRNTASFPPTLPRNAPSPSLQLSPDRLLSPLAAAALSTLKRIGSLSLTVSQRLWRSFHRNSVHRQAQVLSAKRGRSPANRFSPANRLKQRLPLLSMTPSPSQAGRSPSAKASPDRQLLAGLLLLQKRVLLGKVLLVEGRIRQTRKSAVMPVIFEEAEAERGQPSE